LCGARGVSLQQIFVTVINQLLITIYSDKEIFLRELISSSSKSSRLMEGELLVARTLTVAFLVSRALSVGVHGLHLWVSEIPNLEKYATTLMSASPRSALTPDMLQWSGKTACRPTQEASGAVFFMGVRTRHGKKRVCIPAARLAGETGGRVVTESALERGRYSFLLAHRKY